MSILFIVPRFHTNLFYPTKILKDEGFNINMHVFGKGISEDHQYVKPKFIQESYLTKIINFFFSKNIKYNSMYLPSITKYIEELNKIKPKFVIIRPVSKLFFFLILFLKFFYKYKIIFYQQFTLKEYKKFFIKKILFYFLFLLFDIKFISPIFEKKKLPKNFYFFPFIYPVKKKIKKNKIKKILLVAKFIKTKNIFFFLRAINEVSKDKYNFSITIIGEVSDDQKRNYLSYIKNLIKKENIKNIRIRKNIKFKKMKNIYDDHDIFVLPSNHDPAPVSIIEALSRNLIVVASDKCGTKNYIKDNVNGYIFRNNDVNSLKEKLQKSIKFNLNKKKALKTTVKITSFKIFINKINKIIST